MKSKNDDRGMVEVRQLSEPAWTVEVKELGADDSVQKTAAR
ncbi:MAG TPA: hypothetical protein VIL28_03205 [Steroidobacteraceae bacterium]